MQNYAYIHATEPDKYSLITETKISAKSQKTILPAIKKLLAKNQPLIFETNSDTERKLITQITDLLPNPNILFAKLKSIENSEIENIEWINKALHSPASCGGSRKSSACDKLTAIARKEFPNIQKETALQLWEHPVTLPLHWVVTYSHNQIIDKVRPDYIYEYKEIERIILKWAATICNEFQDPLPIPATPPEEGKPSPKGLQRWKETQLEFIAEHGYAPSPDWNPPPARVQPNISPLKKQLYEQTKNSKLKKEIYEIAIEFQYRIDYESACLHTPENIQSALCLAFATWTMALCPTTDTLLDINVLDFDREDEEESKKGQNAYKHLTKYTEKKLTKWINQQ
jgi:hypothetical protein